MVVRRVQTGQPPIWYLVADCPLLFTSSAKERIFNESNPCVTAPERRSSRPWLSIMAVRKCALKNAFFRRQWIHALAEPAPSPHTSGTFRLFNFSRPRVPKSRCRCRLALLRLGIENSDPSYPNRRREPKNALSQSGCLRRADLVL